MIQWARGSFGLKTSAAVRSLWAGGGLTMCMLFFWLFVRLGLLVGACLKLGATRTPTGLLLPITIQLRASSCFESARAYPPSPSGLRCAIWRNLPRPGTTAFFSLPEPQVQR